MRIAMFSNTFLPMLGGIEKSVATFAEDFRQTGNPCLVVTPAMEGAEKSTREVLRVPALKHVGGSAFSLQLPVPGLITSHMDDFAPDVIHSHHPFLMGDSALRNAWRLGVPLVMTYHTLWDRYADFFPNETFKNIVVRLSVEFANACDCIVAPSPSLAEMIRQLGVTTPIQVIPTGIDLMLFGNGNREKGRTLLGITPDRHLAGYVGRVGPEKNLAWLCEAAAQWCAFDKQARFAVIGPSEEYGPTLRAVFDAAGLGSRLLLPGTFQGADLADVYAALDVFTFSSHSDTQGIVLAEAMASGLPVVALEAPGAREAVEDGVSGFLLPADSNKRDFAGALVRIFSDSRSYALMQDSARERAKAYDRRLTASQMLSLYKGLTPERVAKSAAYASEHGKKQGRIVSRLEAEWKLIHSKVMATADAVSHRG